MDPLSPPDPTAPAPPMAPTPPPDMQDPAMAQGAPAVPPEVTPEQKKALIMLLQQVQAKMQNFHATNFAAKNKVEGLRRDLLKQVFQKLQLVGVDLTDRQSVAAFLSKLQDQNPELAKQFEDMMSALLGTGSGILEPMAQPPMGDTIGADENETPPQAV